MPPYVPLCAGGVLNAGALMLVGMIGLYQRHGRLGTLGIVGLAIAGLGVTALLVARVFHFG